MKDHQASAWFEQGRQNARAAAKLLTRDAARRIAANIQLRDAVLDAGPLGTIPGAGAFIGRSFAPR